VCVCVQVVRLRPLLAGGEANTSSIRGHQHATFDGNKHATGLPAWRALLMNRGIIARTLTWQRKASDRKASANLVGSWNTYLHKRRDQFTPCTHHRMLPDSAGRATSAIRMRRVHREPAIIVHIANSSEVTVLLHRRRICVMRSVSC
jgi:hypothetical protein